MTRPPWRRLSPPVRKSSRRSAHDVQVQQRRYVLSLCPQPPGGIVRGNRSPDTLEDVQ